MGTHHDLSPYEHAALMLWTSRPDGSLDYVNQTCLDYFGRTEEQMIEWGWAALLREDEVSMVGELWSAALEAGTPYEAKFHVKRHDGVYTLYLHRATPDRDDEGNITRWIGYSVDISNLQ